MPIRLLLAAHRTVPAVARFATLISGMPSTAQNTSSKAHVNEVLKGLGQGQRIGAVAISPDGSMLAYTRPGKNGSELVLAPFSDPAHTTQVSAAKKSGHCVDNDPAWALDSRHLAFLSTCESGGESSQEDVFIATVGGDFASGKPKVEVQRLTEAKGEVGFPEFSPDGSHVAFLYVEGATRPAGALAAMKPWAGVIGEDGVEIQRVAVVDATAKKAVAPSFATPAKLHVYEFDWAPDSKALAYVAADPPGENNWWVAKFVHAGSGV